MKTLTTNFKDLIYLAIDFINTLESIHSAYPKPQEHIELYDAEEPKRLFANLKGLYQEGDLGKLLSFIRHGLNYYISPLPIRPLSGQLLHHKFKIVLHFQRFFELDQANSIAIVEEFFCKVLAATLMKMLDGYDDFNKEFFAQLKVLFSEELESQIKQKNSIFTAKDNVSTPIKHYEKSTRLAQERKTPSLFIETNGLQDDNLDDDLNEVLTSSDLGVSDTSTETTPVSRYKEVFTPLLPETPSIFSQPGVTVEHITDSDGEEIVSIIIPAVRPKLKKKEQAQFPEPAKALSFFSQATNLVAENDALLVECMGGLSL